MTEQTKAKGERPVHRKEIEGKTVRIKERAKMIEGYAMHGECQAIKDRRR